MHQVSEPMPSRQLSAVTLLGNLVAAPDIRYRANPVSAITEITIATSSKWLDKKTSQYKEWTSYHQVNVEGKLVEEVLLDAQKGDVILVQGYVNDKPSTRADNSVENSHSPIVEALFIQKFAKGYVQSINQIHCSGEIISSPKLIKTPNNKQMLQLNISIAQQVYDVDKQQWRTIPLERELHLWGTQAQTLADKAKLSDSIVIEGKLSYLSSGNKMQFIEGKTAQVL